MIYNPSGSRRILTVDQGDEQAPKRRIVTVLSDPERYARTNPKDMVHRLSVSTEELRNGCVKSILIERSVICGKCSGSGGTPESALIDCTACSGKGLCVKWEVGNPIKFNGCESCDDCFGMGKRQQNLCWTCSGRRVTTMFYILHILGGVCVVNAVPRYINYCLGCSLAESTVCKRIQRHGGRTAHHVQRKWQRRTGSSTASTRRCSYCFGRNKRRMSEQHHFVSFNIVTRQCLYSGLVTFRTLNHWNK